MQDQFRKGRALQLEGITHTPVKVTVGFKCEGREKVALANEAQNCAMTLSEYVEYLVSLRHERKPTLNRVPTTNPQDLVNAKAVIQQLTQKLAFYEENVTLQNLFKISKGKSISFEDALGKKRNITINDVSDIFSIVISTFKTN